MRVKESLLARGVEFAAVSLWDDPDAAEEIRAAGLRGVPVVRVGDRFVLGLDSAQVDELLGLDRDLAARPLSGRELAERATTLLASAVRFAHQLPSAHYADETPREGPVQPTLLPDGSPVRFPDGSRYVPHDTYLGLVRHIVGHGAKLLYLAENPDADAYRRFEVWVPLGEPDPSWTAAAVLERLEELACALRGSVESLPAADLERVVTAYDGRLQTLQEALQANVYSIAQHTRQLMSVLESLGVEPDGRVRDEDYEGLGVPAHVWD